jgi:hypothetical protein
MLCPSAVRSLSKQHVAHLAKAMFMDSTHINPPAPLRLNCAHMLCPPRAAPATQPNMTYLGINPATDRTPSLCPCRRPSHWATPSPSTWAGRHCEGNHKG